MTMSKDSGRLAWLMAALGAKKDKITHLVRRLTGLGTPGSMEPSIFHKFINMLGQIADEKEEENKIFDRIEAIELEHKRKLKNNQLKCAGPRSKEETLVYQNDNCAPEPPKRGLLWLLALLALTSNSKNNIKNQ